MLFGDRMFCAIVTKKGMYSWQKNPIEIIKRNGLLAHLLVVRWVIGSQKGTIWWRHQMETISVLLALCVGNSPVFPLMMTSPNGNILRVTGQWRGALMFS